MAIMILNISEKHGKPYGEGEQVYSLRKNRVELCQFRHRFEDGLETCLRKAADAIQKQKQRSNPKCQS